MRLMLGKPWGPGLLGLVLVAMVVVSVPAFAASPINKLSGRWSGWGSVQFLSGANEKVKCVATYFIKEAGRAVRQNLRCASASYKIDAVANYGVSGSRVTGHWQERVHSTQGRVSGTSRADGFSLTIVGESFRAPMTLSTTACKQSISIRPRGLDISRISIRLRKC